MLALPMPTPGRARSIDAAKQALAKRDVRCGKPHSLVNHHDANTLLRSPLEAIQALRRRQESLPAAALVVEDQGRRVFQQGFVRRPTAGDHNGLHAFRLRQQIRKQAAAGNIVVVAKPVVGFYPPCNKGDARRG